MKIEEELKQKKQEIDELIERFLPEEEGYAKTVAEAVNYSVRAGGKRIRPMLLLETHRLFHRGILPEAEALAVALELVHTYSLVHDDLPAMDNDELRRGMPTTHKRYGEAIGILAGDALLNLSMQTAMQAFRRPSEPMIVAKAISDLYDKAGIDGMIGGQTADVLAEKRGEKIEKGKLDFIYEKKTGALIEASMMIGCRLAPESREKDVTAVERAARLIGMAFQIQDDILDVEGIEEVLGKPIGSDYRNNKSTYVNFVGMERAKKDVKELTEEAVSLMKPYIGEDDFLIRLMKMLAERKY